MIEPISLVGSEVAGIQKIDGIGPYIEQKLNEIGVYNYDQISRFTDAESLAEILS